MDPLSTKTDVSLTAAAATAGTLPAPSLRRFYSYQLLTEIGLTTGIWILYLQHLGLSLAEIGLAEAAFHLAPITLELPSGSFSDVFGRKWSLAASALCIALSAFLMLTADSLWQVMLAMYLQGASLSLRSGTTQAFLFDSLANQDATSTFARLLGRLYSATYLILAAGTWLGAILADRSFAIPYALTIAIGLGGVWLALGLREPARERTAHRSMRRTMIEAMSIVRGQPRLATLLVFNAVTFTLLTLVHLYAQAILADLGLTTSQVGLVIGVALLATAAGTWLAHRAGGWAPFRRWAVALAIIVIGAGLGLGSGVLAAAVGIYLLAEFLTGIYEPLSAARINHSVQSAQRATVLSIEGFMFSIMMIWAFPLAGWTAERWGWLATFSGASVVVLVVLIVWLALDREAPADEGDPAVA